MTLWWKVVYYLLLLLLLLLLLFSPELSQATGMALVRSILGKFLGVVCHCFPPRLDVPTFATKCLNDARDPSGGRWNCGRECCPVILPKWRLPRPLGILLQAANLRHGTDGFTCPPKEGVLRIFSSLNIRRLRPGLNPRTWVLKASTLPLDLLISEIKNWQQVNTRLWLKICTDMQYTASQVYVIQNELYTGTIFTTPPSSCKLSDKNHRTA